MKATTEEILIRLIRRFFADNSPFFSPIIRWLTVLGGLSAVLLLAEQFITQQMLPVPPWLTKVNEIALWVSLVTTFLLKFTVQEHPDPTYHNDVEPPEQIEPQVLNAPKTPKQKVVIKGNDTAAKAQFDDEEEEFSEEEDTGEKVSIPLEAWDKLPIKVRKQIQDAVNSV